MRMIALVLGLFSAGIAPTPSARGADAPEAGKARIYVGTYTRGGSRGIYRLEMDTVSGALGPGGLAAESVNPSFLAIRPDGRFLYAVNEVADFGGRSSGAVTGFAVDAASGALEPLNQQPSGGGGPCHLAIDRRGAHVLVANYGGGSVAVLPIGADGRLGASTAFLQHEGAGPAHAHWIAPDAADRFAIAADLGLDRLFVYRFDGGRGSLTPNDPPFASLAPKAGPRHVAFHPDGRHLYVINETSSTVTAFAYDPDRGTLAGRETLSTRPAGAHGGNTTAEIAVHPSGRFLYGSNRGDDSLAGFAINGSTGRLAPIGHWPTGGKTPRNFAIDPSGTFLLAANQDSNSVVVFRIDPRTGRLAPTGHSAVVPMPVCVVFLPGAPGR